MQESPGRGAAVEFVRDVQPILTQHCVRCHGPEEQNGGLRLDSREFAESGGDSRQPILGGSLETNALYARVATSDAAVRMPKGADPLSADELRILEDWIAQGTPWPDADAADRSADQSDQAWSDKAKSLLRWIGKIEQRFLAAYDIELKAARPLLILLIVLLVALFASERARKQKSESPSSDAGARRKLAAAFGRVQRRHYGVALLLLIAATVIVMQSARNDRLSAGVVELRQQLQMYQQQSTFNNTFAKPPVPVRLKHPPRLGGEYYRGNCERNEKLFNGGNYRTATMRVQLCDGRRRPMVSGEEVDGEELLVRFELERPPGATEQLFTPAIIDSVFLTTQWIRGRTPIGEEPLVRLQTIEDGSLWEAYYPIERAAEKSEEVSGVIYVYKGRIDDTIAAGVAHYGIKYDLQIRDGRLQPESEVWMGCLFVPGAVAPPVTGKVPFHEWFDYRPLPIITGPNTDDPRLLGIDEHVIRPVRAPKP